MSTEKKARNRLRGSSVLSHVQSASSRLQEENLHLSPAAPPFASVTPASAPPKPNLRIGHIPSRKRRRTFITGSLKIVPRFFFQFLTGPGRLNKSGFEGQLSLQPGVGTPHVWSQTSHRTRSSHPVSPGRRCCVSPKRSHGRRGWFGWSKSEHGQRCAGQRCAGHR